MLKEQEMFLNFFIERTQPEHAQQAKELLVQSFANQATQAFTKGDLDQLQQQLLPLVKPEMVAEVTAAMNHFKGQLS